MIRMSHLVIKNVFQLKEAEEARKVSINGIWQELRKTVGTGVHRQGKNQEQDD
jgi:hypothetical protein